jgi:hypothetical protein
MRNRLLFVLFSIALLCGAAQGQSGEWKQLFDGKDLTGWKHVGPGFMTVEYGLIHTHGGMGLLYWTALLVSSPRGIHYARPLTTAVARSLEPREEWMPVHYGYEVQIDNEPEKSNEDDKHITGTLYSLATPLAKTGKPGPEWNTMEITLDGPRTIVMLNGAKVTDFKEGDPVPERKFDFEPQRGPRPMEGWFGLQNHSKDDIVFFKEVAIKKLK